MAFAPVDGDDDDRATDPAAGSGDTAALIAGLPSVPALDDAAVQRLARLELPWPAGEAQAWLAGLPLILPPPRAPLAPKAFWRHLFCLASVSDRLVRLSAAHAAGALGACEAVQAASLTPIAVLIVATGRPGTLRRAAGVARRRGLPLAEALALADLDLGAIQLAVAQRWSLPPGVIASGSDRHGTTVWSAARLLARWLLVLKRMPPPLDDTPSVPSSADIARLGLGPRGLVEALVDLGDSVDHGRRLARVALELAARPGHRRGRPA